MGDEWNKNVWQLVACIPAGKVATYGQLAAMLGYPRRSRHVGFALKQTPEQVQIPWYRVVNSSGRISLPEMERGHTEQRVRLEQEGIEFTAKGNISLRRFRWNP